TPRIGDASRAPGSYAAYAPESRLSAVPKTVPPAAGPPLATTQQRPTAKTASMPEVVPERPRVAPTQSAMPGVGAGYPAMPAASAPRRRQGPPAWVWLLLALLLLGGAALGTWLVYDVYFKDSTP